jgi:hypothetical protein
MRVEDGSTFHTVHADTFVQPEVIFRSMTLWALINPIWVRQDAILSTRQQFKITAKPIAERLDYFIGEHTQRQRFNIS